MSEVKITKDIRSLADQGQLLALAGTIVDFMSDEGDYIIVQTKDGALSFPLEEGEYALLDDGIPHQEGQEGDEALWMSRGKVLK